MPYDATVAYQPIESYGVIGDMRTAALVGSTGSLDWLCFPHFDSPSVFAAILDDDRGGRFVISPAGEGYRSKQLYYPDSNVLVTRFLSNSGVAEVIDYMPVGAAAEKYGRRGVMRMVKSVRGTMRLRMRCAPAFDFARVAHRAELAEGGAWFRSSLLDLALGSDVPIRIDGTAAVAEFSLAEGEGASFVLGEGDPQSGDLRWPPERQMELLIETVAYWHKWLSKCTYRGRWREMVHRSALVLKLLTFDAQRGHRGRPDVRPARGAGRHPQLGLPLHLDSRRRLYALRLPADRFHRRGRQLHGFYGRPLP